MMDILLGLEQQGDYLSAAARNERWAQEVLYKKYYPTMMSICLRYANHREDALDILHEGFIKVFKNINKFTSGTSFDAWIKRVMVNTAIDYYRKKKRRRTEDLDSVYHVSSPNPGVLSQLQTKDILNCLQKLSPSYRAVFNLYIIEGYSHREIAEKLNISESTSRSNLVKARSKLRVLLIAMSEEYDRR